MIVSLQMLLQLERLRLMAKLEIDDISLVASSPTPTGPIVHTSTQSEYLQRLIEFAERKIALEREQWRDEPIEAESQTITALPLTRVRGRNVISGTIAHNP